MSGDRLALRFASPKLRALRSLRCALQRDDGQGSPSLKKVDLETHEIVETVFSQPGADVNGIVRDSVSRRPIGVSYTEHERRYFFWDAEFAMLQRSVDRTLKGTVNTITSMTQDKTKLIVSVESDRDPGTFYLWDRAAKQLQFFSEVMPGLLPDLLSPMEPLSYEARDGLTIPAYLTLPLSEEKTNLPLVVMPHGGPHARTVRGFWFLRHFLASRGYAVFEPNFRGSTGYGARFQSAGRQEWGGKMQDDVTDGVQWLVDQGIADPENICIVGWSYGGYAAAMGAVKTPDLYQCAASINGVTDLPDLISFDRKFVGGSEWTKSMGMDGESAKAVSPYHQAEKIKIPLLLIHAEDDARVPVRESRRLAKRLKKLKQDVTLRTVKRGRALHDR